MEEAIISMILVVFPILMYLVINCYDVINNKNIMRIIFILTMCTSLYLCLNLLSQFNNINIIFLFCNIPILICYFKKEGILGVILSLIVVVSNYTNDLIYIIFIKYLGYLAVYIILYKKKNFNYLFFKLTAIIQGFFISFEYFVNSYLEIDDLIKLICYILIIYFITFFGLYLFKLADRIRDLYSMINKSNEENKLKNSLFKLTHEIKNPLAVCKGYLDMINLNDYDKSKRYVGIIKSEIDRSLNVMNDFMEYSKIKINKDIFDINMLLDEVYDSFKILVDNKNIKFNYTNNYEDIYLFGDYERIKQVFVNVIKNSIESINLDGIIDMNVLIVDKMVKIIISDNGSGMDSEEIKNIYNMFYTTKKNGTGVGVTLSNEIIVAHNGKMEYESTKGKGTKCIISLPM